MTTRPMWLVFLFAFLLTVPASGQTTQWIGATVGAGGGGGGVGDAVDTEVTWNNSGTLDGVAGLTTDGTDITQTAGSQFFLDDGALGAPSLAFASDTDWGLYVRDTGTIGVGQGGAIGWGFGNTRVRGAANFTIEWTGVTGNPTTTQNISLNRDGSGILGQRSAAVAQSYRIYESYTSGAVNQGLSIDAGVTASDTITLTPFDTGAGAPNQNLELNSIGTGDIVLDSSDTIALEGEISIEGSAGVDCTSAAAVTVVNGIVTACS